ncbi:aldo/keto reductase [Anaerosacchariphilus polymeriproducens]|uniref:Aldo/keto reductase n=1 Tax=Anaerosacchariphilus polymeriproducens TaxID=1812858 RepID=A0A371AS17_9FIRM|nr:aldo/keto reductase [Anaerosacchariphilus polymeriproducens]RDU22354.1 aldo/keto reductase [Anaerosacchariphilus polymeriproducens]
MKSLQDCYTLNNGVEIPCLGLGTWKVPFEQVVPAVKEAIKIGYRHIDTATSYGNEAGVGQAIQECGVPREQLFITSKLWNPHQGYESTHEAFQRTLNELGLDYLDLYLIHWPIGKEFPKEQWKELNQATWKAFEELYEAGKIRAIGVSNFLPHHLENLMESAKIQPMVDQLEIHPGMLQENAVSYAKEKNMLVEAWSPLSTGKLFELKELKDLASKYNRTVAQVCLRWNLQKGHLPIPKTVTPSRMIENSKIFEFSISPEDMKLIDELTDCGWSGFDPDHLVY